MKQSRPTSDIFVFQFLKPLLPFPVPLEKMDLWYPARLRYWIPCPFRGEITTKAGAFAEGGKKNHRKNVEENLTRGKKASCVIVKEWGSVSHLAHEHFIWSSSHPSRRAFARPRSHPTASKPGQGYSTENRLHLVISQHVRETISRLPSAEAEALFTSVLLRTTPLNPASSRSARRFGRLRSTGSPKHPVPPWKSSSHGPCFILLLPYFSSSFPPQNNSFYPLKLGLTEVLSCLPSSLPFLIFYGTYVCHYKSWGRCKSEKKETHAFWMLSCFFFLKTVL